MLRSFLIYLSKAGWAQRLVTGWGFAWKAASRFVAGETVQDGQLVAVMATGRAPVEVHHQLGRVGRVVLAVELGRDQVLRSRALHTVMVAPGVRLVPVRPIGSCLAHGLS